MADYPDPDFKQMVVDGGVPTTEAEMTAELDTALEDAGSRYANPAEISPFKRIVKALVVVPALLLVDMMVAEWLPNTFLRTAKKQWLELLAWALGLERKSKVKAQGNITFNRNDATGALTISAGTVVPSISIDGKVYNVIVLADTLMDDGVASIDVLCEAEQAGAAYNLAAGMYAIVPQTLPTIDSVTNASDWLVQPGADEETDEQLRLRCRNQWNAVNQWHTDAVYRAIISSFDGVLAENVYFDGDAPRGAGTADAFVLMQTGNPGAAFLQSIEDEIMVNGNHGHGDDVRLFAMPEDLHTITATVWPKPGLSSARQTTLMTGVEAFIRAAFRENQTYKPTLTKPFDRFSFSTLDYELHKQFADLDSIEFDQGDIVTLMAVARIDSLTLTNGLNV